jgi:hypothetical protein
MLNPACPIRTGVPGDRRESLRRRRPWPHA